MKTSTMAAWGHSGRAGSGNARLSRPAECMHGVLAAQATKGMSLKLPLNAARLGTPSLEPPAHPNPTPHLCGGAQHDVEVEADLVRHRGGVRRQPARDLPRLGGVEEAAGQHKGCMNNAG